MIDLQQASSNLLLEEGLNERIITEDRIRLFVDALNEKRDVERRLLCHLVQNWLGEVLECSTSYVVQ